MQAFALTLAIVLAEGPAASEGSGLGINAAFLISQMISFAIVFLILWKWGFPAIMKTLDERQRKIRQGIEDADKAKQDLENATQRAEKILSDARIQAQETIDRASKAAQQQASQIVEEAQARAEQVSQQQIARIQQEASRARAELSRLVVNLSIDAAGKVISRSVDSRDNRQLVEEFVSASDQARNN